MKNKFNIFLTFLALIGTLSLASCLKDKSHYVNFGNSGTFVDFPLGGYVNFGSDAITAAPDTTTGLINQSVGVNVASPNVPTVATTVKLDVNDQADVANLNKIQSAVTYLIMPTDAYTISTTSVTIPAGQQYATFTITFNKALLDPSLSYVLPVKIVSTTNGQVSANLSVHYYHFIGNDFAGAYKQDFQRYNAADSTSAPLNGQSFVGQPATFSPVSPTQFEVYSGYAGGIYRYEVTFTKTGLGASATYSNFAVTLNSADVAAEASSISILQQPKFLTKADPSKSYTYAESFQFFHFQYVAMTSAPRYLIDRYYK